MSKTRPRAPMCPHTAAGPGFPLDHWRSAFDHLIRVVSSPVDHYIDFDAKRARGRRLIAIYVQFAARRLAHRPGPSQSADAFRLTPATGSKVAD